MKGAGRIGLTNGRWYEARLINADCIAAKRCLCGFCKAYEQCEFGDCHNTRVSGNLCKSCGAIPWRVALPGLHS
jgi:hypothetical protein